MITYLDFNTLMLQIWYSNSLRTNNKSFTNYTEFDIKIQQSLFKTLKEEVEGNLVHYDYDFDNEVQEFCSKYDLTADKYLSLH